MIVNVYIELLPIDKTRDNDGFYEGTAASDGNLNYHCLLALLSTANDSKQNEK